MIDGTNATSGGNGAAVSELPRPSASREREPDPALFRDAGSPIEDPAEQPIEESGVSTEGTESTSDRPSEGDRASFSSVEEAERHFQSAKDKEVAKVQAEKADLLTRLERLEGQLEMQAKAQQSPEPAASDSPYGNILEGYEVVLPEDSTLVGEEGTLKQIVDGAIQTAVKGIFERQAAEMQQTQAQQATQKVAAGAMGWTPEQQQGLMSLADRYAQALVEDPDGFLSFAKLQLGVQDAAPAPAPTPTKLAGQATAASDRPTPGAASSASTAGRKFSSMSEAIRDAVRNHPR